MLTWNVLNRLPDIVVMAGVLLAGISWIVSRRIELARGKSGRHAAPETPPGAGNEKD